MATRMMAPLQPSSNSTSNHNRPKAKSMPSVVFRMNSNGSASFNLDNEEMNVWQENDSGSEPEDEKSRGSMDWLEMKCVNTEESRIRRSVSNVEQSKFRLRDISPSRLREKHRERHGRKKPDKGAKLSPSCTTAKNIRSSSSSWLPVSFQQMFPSYKSKAGDFRRLFKDIPESEKLITDYSCALQRDILVHGRLYVSQSWLCFYANIFGWETLVTINLTQVMSMTKEKTALVIPNAIQVWTEVEKYFFTSFVSRDSTYRSLSRVWQNALSDEPECIPALMKAVGKYVDVDSEDVDNGSRGSNDELPSDYDDDIIVDEDIDDESLVDSEELNSNDSQKETGSNKTRSTSRTNSLEDRQSSITSVPDIAVSPASPTKLTPVNASVATTAAQEEQEKTEPKEPNSVTPRRKTDNPPEMRRRFPFPFKKDLSPLLRRKNQGRNKIRGSSGDSKDCEHRDSLIEEGSISDSNEDDQEGPILCPCESHLDLECLNEEYAIDVDRLYEYLFTDCDFYRSIRSSRKDYDVDIDPWVDTDDKKKRAVKYTVKLNLAIGPKTAKIRENQELTFNEPGQFYVVQTVVDNAGLPYAESFVITHRYCLTRVNECVCRLRVTAAVKYIRPVWGFVKNIISKNSTEALSSFFDFLKNFIRTVEDESVLHARKRLKASRKRQRLPLENKEESDHKQEAVEPIVSSEKAGDQLSKFSKHMWRDSSWFVGLFTLLLFVLIVLNVYLSYRVISLEHSTKSWENIGLPSSLSDWPKNLDEFRNLVYRQQHVQSIQLKRWQHVISTSMQFLQQVQDSLNELKKEVEKPLNT